MTTAGSTADRWLPLVLDLDGTVPDVPTEGAVALHVTAVWRGQPLGTAVLRVEEAVVPGIRLKSQLLEQFAWPLAYARADAVLRGPEGPPVRSGSVVVCTRDRYSSLERCLGSLTRLEALAAGRVQEVVVVDNGVRDEATRRMVEGFGFRWVHELIPGLDRARNRGLIESTGDVVLYTDDDVEVSREWADHLLRCFDDPLVGVATGLVLPAVLDSHHQRTFEEHAGFSRGMHRRQLDGAHDEPTGAGALGAGASMAFDRVLMRSLGGFPEALDAGMPTRTGGDTYGLYRVLRAGYRGVYEPRALASHWHRDGPDELVKTLTGYSTGTYSFLGYAALRDRDPAAVRAMVLWTRDWLGRRLVGAALRRPSAPPLALAWAEVRGAVATPRALRSALRLAEERGELAVYRVPDPLVVPVPEDPDGPLPSVSVIVDARRTEPPRALVKSLLAQTHRPDHVVVLVAPAGASDLGLGHRVDVLHVEPSESEVQGVARAVRAARGDLVIVLEGGASLLSEGVLAAHAAVHSGSAGLVAVGPRIPGAVPEHPHALAVRNARADRAARLSVPAELEVCDFSFSNVSMLRRTFLDVIALVRPPDSSAGAFGLTLARHGVPLRSVPAGAVMGSPMQSVSEDLVAFRGRGRADVEIALSFPEAAHLLPLHDMTDLGPRRTAALNLLWRSPRLRSVTCAILPAAVTTPPLVTTRKGFHRRWRHASFLAYAVGVIEAVGSPRRLAELVERPAAGEDAVLDLAAPTWAPPSTAAQHLHVVNGGSSVATVRRSSDQLPLRRSSVAHRVREQLAEQLFSAATAGRDDLVPTGRRTPQAH